jgi:hypothetical protein
MDCPAMPTEQLERIQAIVDDLLAKLRALGERLPPNTESALIFQLPAEDRD